MKYLFWLLVALLMAGSVAAATDKVLVVTYDSAEEMLQDLGRVKEKAGQAKADAADSIEEKTWVHCTRYYCYQVPLVTVVVPVLPTMRVQPVSKYHYNPIDGKYVNPWDEREEYYRYGRDYRFDDRRFQHCKRYRDGGETYYKCYW